jgi:branched-chain amino acid transport system permease protein
MGKALNAVRDDEIAADAMTVDTRKTKMAAFMFGAFWAGVAGGLLAHVLRYINPGFGIQKLAEVLAMVYFGGLNSVVRVHRGARFPSACWARPCGPWKSSSGSSSRSC